MDTARPSTANEELCRAFAGVASPARRLGLSLFTAILLLAFATVTAQAFPSRALYRTQRLCSIPTRERASCLGVRLIARSLTSAELAANAGRQAHELASGVRPLVTNKNVPGGLTPAALHEAYQLPDETPAADTQTVGIVDAFNDPTAEADLAVYDKQFGLPECTTANGCFRKLNQSGKTSPLPATNGQWATEISLDVQMVHATCQTCRIVLVEASSETWGNLGTAVNEAVAAGATEVSNSYGGPEFSGYAELGPAYYEHPGIVVTVSSGDCGYFNQGCSGWTAAANFPAVAPHVVAVGGTSLSKSGETWTSTAWSGGGSGCSQVFTAAPWQASAEGFSAEGCSYGRSVADVAAVADPYTGVDIYDSTPAGSGDPTGWGVVGGTSAASPIVAGEFGLGGGARGVAYPASTLYSHLGDSSALYDVTAGSNGSCSGTTACHAATGADGPTGVGSPVGLGVFDVAGAPVETVAPAVSGSAEQGQTLTASAGVWSEGTTPRYQWALCNSSGELCTAISGATGTTLVLGSSMVGHTVRVIATESNTHGGGTPAGSPVTAVISSNEPKITGFTPASAITGATITITGSALRSASSVRFGSATALFSVVSSTELTATVPNGAVAGTITVTTPVKSAVSAVKFTPSFSVVSESPSRAAAGTLITITGAGFNESSLVKFNGVAASGASVVSSTSIKVKVPAGATTGPISITNTAAPAGTVRTAGSFVVA